MRAFIALLALALALPACAQPVERFVEGKNYQLIDPPQPTSSGDKVEVIEVFMYTCHHCADLEPFLAKWEEKKPEGVAYSPLPVAWGGASDTFARAFYAAETLGVLKQTHQKMFDAVHKERLPFASLDDIAAWYEKNAGVKKADFINAANSFAVNAKINRSKQMVPRYGVAGTPTIIVNGKYRFDVTNAGGHQNVGDLIDFLVAKEKAAKPAAKS